MTSMAFGFWVAMTPLVWAVFGYVADKIDGNIDDEGRPRDHGGAFVSLVVFVPLWWALYFAIGMLREVVG